MFTFSGKLVSLKLYSLKGKPKRELFYNEDWGSSLLFKARSNSFEVNDRTYRFRESRDRNWGITKPRTSASCGRLRTVVQTLQIKGLET